MSEISLLFFLVTGLLAQQENELQRYRSTRPLMGVEFSIILYAENEEVASKAIEDAFEEIEAIDRALSDYRPKSEINLLCESAPHETPVRVSALFIETCQLARRIHQESDGAFDITIGPASKLWRAARKNKRLPTREEIQEAKSKIDFTQLRLTSENDEHFASIPQPGMQMDFGGIAKGLAADKAMMAIEKHGIKSALINASGDILVSAPPPGKDGWTVQIPGANQNQTITLANSAIATSGDVYQFLEVDGVRYSHIINPKTADAITEPRIVTVIHRQGACADAYASALSVMGEEGLSLASEGGFAAQIISATNKELTEFEVQRTQDFPDLPEHKRAAHR